MRDMTNPNPKQNTNSNHLYEFTEFELTEKDDFDQLVFMGAPSTWKTSKDENSSYNFLYDLCHKPLKYVVEKVMRGRKHSDPTLVFEKLLDIKAKDEAYPWFLQHMRISRHFNKELMGRLWIRNLTKYDDSKKVNTISVKGQSVLKGLFTWKMETIAHSSMQYILLVMWKRIIQ